MMNDSIGTTGFQPGAVADERLFDSWFDPIEHAVRHRVRSFIEELIEGERSESSGSRRGWPPLSLSARQVHEYALDVWCQHL